MRLAYAHCHANGAEDTDAHGDHLTEIGRSANGVGDVSGFAPPGDIHRVHNTGDETAISLHVYGADLSVSPSSVGGPAAT